MRPASLLVTCQQATLLLEQQADKALPLKARFQLWSHLRFCPYCRRYRIQAELIAYLAKRARAPL